MDPLLVDDEGSDQTPNMQDTLAWLDDIAEIQMSSGASAASGSGLLSESSLQAGASPNLPSSGFSSSLSPVSGEDGYASASASSSSEDGSQRAKRSKIALDSNQPLTAKGKPRTRVYVACHECRTRKIRCDGGKPVCYNCHRRDPGIQACDYDAGPRRRGHDKVPGSRIRSAGRGAAPTRAQPHPGAANITGEVRERCADLPSSNLRWRHVKPPQVNFEDIIQGFDPASFDPTAPAIAYQLPSPPATERADEDEDDQIDQIIAGPSMEFTRETWWDSLLALYASEESGSDPGDVILTPAQRLSTTQHVYKDLRALFRASVYWASFLHLPRFFEALLDPARRVTIQPGLILGMLAVGAHVQSSELREGERGRKRAARLLEQADAALQASLSSNWVDVGLVQAAWFITYYEMQGPPCHDYYRLRSAMLLLDSLIQLLSLNTLDAGLPESRYSVFSTSHPSLAGPTQPSFNMDEMHSATYHAFGSNSPSCGCAKFTLQQQWPTVSDIAPQWSATTIWPDKLSEGEIRKEEGRRVVWSSIMLAAGHAGYASADAQLERADLYIKDYHNYALLFPGQVLSLEGEAPIPQNSVWNLCIRAMVLWHTSVRYRSNPAISLEERAQYAMNAWLEADAIETALKSHTCNLESGTMYQAREYLFTTRMCVSHEFNLFAPEVTTAGIMSYYRQKAEAWLSTQMWITNELWEGLKRNPPEELSSRPMLVYWFMGHIIRALILFKFDRSLLIALDASKAFVRPLEYLMRIWPCHEQRLKWQHLRSELVEACLKAGVPPPPPSLPPSLYEIKSSIRPQPEASPSGPDLTFMHL
ncbi:hypothetical protein L226DRAFT_488145, partial [Lentinus tigrinus ALCF2SS1-7]